MKKPARLKPPALATAADFHAALAEITLLQNSAAVLTARRDRLVQKLHARSATRLAPLTAALEARLALVERYARDHRDTLLPRDRKSVALATATIGWRTGNPAVKLAPGQPGEAAVIATLKAHQLHHYIVTTETLARARILAAAQHDDPSAPHLATPAGTAVPLATLGLQITQAETFYVEPRAATDATSKPESAPAAA